MRNLLHALQDLLGRDVGSNLIERGASSPNTIYIPWNTAAQEEIPSEEEIRASIQATAEAFNNAARADLFTSVRDAVSQIEHFDPVSLKEDGIWFPILLQNVRELQDQLQDARATNLRVPKQLLSELLEILEKVDGINLDAFKMELITPAGSIVGPHSIVATIQGEVSQQIDDISEKVAQKVAAARAAYAAAVKAAADEANAATLELLQQAAAPHIEAQAADHGWRLEERDGTQVFVHGKGRKAQVIPAAVQAETVGANS